MSDAQASPVEVVELLEGVEIPASGRKVETLVKTDAFELKRLTLAKGVEIPEHHAPGPITVQCLSGRIAFRAGGVVHVLIAGSLLNLEAREPHALAGVEDSVVLVTKLAPR